MSKKKACRVCKMFVDGNECPVCKTSQFVLNWRGRISILNASESEIAKKVGIVSNGEYAIKVG